MSMMAWICGCWVHGKDADIAEYNTGNRVQGTKCRGDWRGEINMWSACIECKMGSRMLYTFNHSSHVVAAPQPPCTSACMCEL